MHLKRQMAHFFILSFMATCLFLISFALPVHADSYYVDITDGTDQAGCGQQGSPCRTLHYTISNFVDGDDTVYMAAGTYNIANEGDSSLVITNNNVTIQGDTSGSTIIDGYSTGEPTWTTGIEINDATGVIIQNLTISNFQSYGIHIDSCSPDIRNNILVDNPTAIYIYAYGQVASPSIINNLVYEETSNAMDYGIDIYGFTSGSDAYPIIYHNTIDGGTTTGIRIREDVGVTTVEPIIKYNIITSFGEYGIRYNGSQNPVIDYNLLFDHTESNYVGITGGSNDIINQDPAYEDPSSHDYHLQSTSPCIDTIPSNEADTSITDDLEGNQRPSPTGGDYDMGCYEFQQEPPPAEEQPVTPTNESPSNFEVFGDDTTSVTLESSAFSDPDDNNTHASTKWRIRREDRGVYNCDDYDASFAAVYTSGAGLTSHEVLGLASGMQYVWQVRYQNSNEIWSLWSEEYRFMIGTSALDSDVQIEGNTSVASYRMVSFPLWPDDNQCMTFFSDELGGAYNTTQLRLGTYDAETGGYMECGSNMTIKPGRSYWFLSKNDMDIDVSGVPVATGLDIEVGLQYGDSGGWNMIACPNNANYNWLSVEVLVSDGSGETTFGPTPISDLSDDNPYIDVRLWRWEDGSYFDDTQTLEHHEGYWVNARAENVYLRFRSDLAIADSGQQRTVSSAYAKASTKIKKWVAAIIDTRHAVASDETPPLPPGVHDEPETKSCFIHTAFD